MEKDCRSTENSRHTDRVAAVNSGRDAEKGFEMPDKAGGGTVADTVCNFRNAEIRCGEQTLCLLDSAHMQIPVRRHPDLPFKKVNQIMA